MVYRHTGRYKYLCIHMWSLNARFVHRATNLKSTHADALERLGAQQPDKVGEPAAP